MREYKMERWSLAVAFAACVVGTAPGTASAVTPKVDASMYTVHCNTVLGQASFKPKLTAAGGAPAVVTVKATLAGCTATGTPAVTVISGTISGKLTTPTSSCTGLLGPSTPTGTLKIVWKTTPALTNKVSMLTPGTVAGGVFPPGAPFTASYASFHIGGGSTGVTGAFAGTDAGATSIIDALTSQDVSVLAACVTTGLSKVNLGIGEVQLK